jgi:hypothetical protein
MNGYEKPKERERKNAHEIKTLEGFKYGNKKWQMKNWKNKLQKKFKMQENFHQLVTLVMEYT